MTYYSNSNSNNSHETKSKCPKEITLKLHIEEVENKCKEYDAEVKAFEEWKDK